MSPAESDIDLLETDLDGALDAAAAATLARRLAVEPELVSLQEALQTQRQQRQILFQALEPTDTAVEQFAWRIRGAVAEHRAADAFEAERSSRRLPSPWNLARWGGVAACMLISFFAGRGLRTTTPGTVAPPGDPTVAIMPRENGLLPSAPGSDVMVPVSNEYGQVVAWQPFHNTEDARHFAEDLNRTRLPVQPATSDNVKLAADESEQKF